MNWFIEGDIEKCFDTIDHDNLLAIIGKRIRDFRFMKLLRTMLKAGYIEDWQQRPSLIGTPQGGVISPLLANIFLHELDSYVLKEMKPNFDSGQSKRMYRRELAHGSVPEIIRHYDSELRGYYNYYRLASNVSHRLNHLKFIMQRSLARTIANKIKLTRAKVYKRYGVLGRTTGRKTLGVTVETKSGEKVITFGDYSLRKLWLPTNNDRDPFVPALPYKELTQRLSATECD